MSSLSISYLTGIVLASCGAFGVVYVGNMIYPIKGAFGDFKFDETNRNKIKEWLQGLLEEDTEVPDTPIEEDAGDFKAQREEQLQNRTGGAESTVVEDATNFLTVPLDEWTKIGENVGIIYNKFNAIRTLCHKQTDSKQKVALIKLCNLMAQKYDLIIQEIERKLSANEKLIKYEQIFLDAYNILEALQPKVKEELQEPTFTGTVENGEQVAPAPQEGGRRRRRARE